MAIARMTGVGREDGHERDREAMVRRIEELFRMTASETGLARLDAEVRAAFSRVPRHRFVPEEAQALAYADTAFPIGHDQTISQPFIVALMTQLAGVTRRSVVLEVGAGSGYQAAILGELALRVYSIEIVPELARRASETLAALGYDNVEVRCGDGFDGWVEHAPFDAILITAAAPEPPEPLTAQLAPGGRMVLPVGEPYRAQELVVLRKCEDGTTTTEHALPVAFVPLTRDA